MCTIVRFTKEEMMNSDEECEEESFRKDWESDRVFYFIRKIP